MKNPIPLLSIVGMLFLVSACGAGLDVPPQQAPEKQGAAPPAQPPQPGQDPTPKQQPGGEKKPIKRLKVKTRSPGAPDIALSVNCQGEGIALEGKSILIEASIAAAEEEAKTAAVQLSKPGGFWGDLLSIEIRDSRGDLVRAAPKLVSKGDAELALDGERLGWLTWVLDASGDGKLAPGVYSFRAALDADKADGPGWKGTASSPPARVTVKSSSAALSADETRLVALAEIRGLSALDRGTQALAACDRYLGTHAGDGLILEEKGDTLARLGRHAEAIKAYDEALGRPETLPADAVTEPPAGLLQKRQEAVKAAAKR